MLSMIIRLIKQVLTRTVIMKSGSNGKDLSVNSESLFYVLDVNIVDMNRSSVYMKLQNKKSDNISYDNIKMSLGPSPSEPSTDDTGLWSLPYM